MVHARARNHIVTLLHEEHMIAWVFREIKTEPAGDQDDDMSTELATNPRRPGLAGSMHTPLDFHIVCLAQWRARPIHKMTYEPASIRKRSFVNATELVSTSPQGTTCT